MSPFSRHQKGESTSFEFCGFEFRGGMERSGKDHLKRRTARKQLRSARKRFRAWCKEHRHQQLQVLCERLHTKLHGYDHSDGVHGNDSRV